MKKLYEFTRSIRFSLKGDIDIFKVDDASDTKKVYENFLDQYVQLIKGFENTIFYDVENQKSRVKLEVNYKWLRNYVRDDYNKLSDKSVKNYAIREAEFLKDIFSQWISDNKILLDNFKDIISREEQEQARKSDLALCIRQFLSHDHFSFINEFVQYAKDKETSKNLNKLQITIELIEKLTKQIQKKVATSQSNGLEVARASFNYYTINKISKNFDKDLLEEKQKLEDTFSNSLDGQLLKIVGFKDFIEQELIGNNIDKLSLVGLYDSLKEFRSHQKSNFLEALSQEEWRYNNENEKLKQGKTELNTNIDIDKLKGKKFNGFDAFAQVAGIKQRKKEENSHINEKQNIELFMNWAKSAHPLFTIKGNVGAKAFLEITNEIKELGKQKNQAKQSNDYKKSRSLDKQIRDKKIKRGGYFQGNFVFANHFNFCNEYKKVAMQRGKIKAQIRSLEQEKIEARLLKYWAHIIEMDSKKSVLLIPKDGDTLQEAKKYIDNLNQQKSGIILYNFNSFTLRALDKLARRNIGRDIERLNEDPISIYKKILSGEYPQIKIDFVGFENEIQDVILKDDYKDVEDFRMALESISYSVSDKYLSDENIKQLQEKYGAIVFDISSYDLERNISHKKEHTILWDDFWNDDNKKNNYAIRINPELRIFYREAKRDLPKEKRNNRFSKEQLTIAFTLTQNAAKQRIETAFEENDRLVAITKKFNEDIINPFIKNKGEELYYYGIDRGNQELASLCVAQFSKEKYEAMLSDGVKKEFDKPIFPEIITYKIKDDKINTKKEIVIDKSGNKKEITLIDNPSYFIDDDVFEEIHSPFIDLTTAKLIKGKIILNGDIKTLLSLKKANVKRKLFDIFNKIDLDSKIYFDDSDCSFKIDLKKSERNNYQLLCYYTERESSIFSIKQMCIELQQYLNNLRGDRKMETITIDKINNLRDAITSNMVGIIAYLFEQYPGIINLENLQEKSDIDRHFRKNNENIARRLEWSLYKKFQKVGLVPPQLRQTIFLRENKEKDFEKINQFGIIHFIPTENTSANCPYCGEKSVSGKRKGVKWAEHRFVCTNGECIFDTKNNKKSPLEKIANSDDVASYNIAKSKVD